VRADGFGTGSALDIVVAIVAFNLGQFVFCVTVFCFIGIGSISTVIRRIIFGIVLIVRSISFCVVVGLATFVAVGVFRAIVIVAVVLALGMIIGFVVIAFVVDILVCLWVLVFSQGQQWGNRVEVFKCWVGHVSAPSVV